MTNPYEPPPNGLRESQPRDVTPFTLTQKTAQSVWIIGFALQLVTYITLLGSLVFEVNRPYSESLSAGGSEGMNPDLQYSLFNLTICFFAFVSIFAITKCREIAFGQKSLFTIGSIVLFGICWLGFIILAMGISFSTGFQGD